MKLKDLKEWIAKLPKEFDEFDIVNAECGLINEEYTYRLDKPVTMLDVDENTKEILILNDEDKKKTMDLDK